MEPPNLIQIMSTKNIHYRFIEGETHFAMPRGAKKSLAISEPQWTKVDDLHANLTTTTQHAP